MRITVSRAGKDIQRVVAIVWLRKGVEKNLT
jgi:hypothetical protein